MTRQVKILRFWWWLFLLYGLLAVVICGLIYIKVPAKYFSTTKIFVSPTASSALANVYDAPFTDRAVKTVTILAEGNEIIGTVARKSGYNEKIIKKSLKAKSIIGTQVIEIRVEDGDKILVRVVSRLVPSVLEEQLKKIQQNSDAETKDQIKISIAEQSTTPEIDRLYKSKIVFFSLIALILVGYGLYYLIYAYDRSIKEAEDFESMGLNFLGDFSRMYKAGEGARALFNDANRFALESIREVRSSIFLLGNGVKTIAITSLRPKEGKSAFISSLALTLSEVGKKVILIDADLRAPSINKHFGIPLGGGLADYLEGKASREEIITKSEHENLWVVPAGKSISLKASSLIKEDKLKPLLHWLIEAGNVDFILMDTPPLEACSDAALVAKISDGAIVVAEFGKTSHRDLVKIKKLSKKLKANFLGAVLTKTRSRKKYQYYY